MEKTSRIDSILSDIKELEGLLSELRGMEVYPVACFSRSFDLAYHLLKELHILEGEQIETLHRQMEEYRKMIDAAPTPPHVAEPEPAQIRPARLNDGLSKGRLADLRKSLVLNDRFYFRKELFGGDEGWMNQAIDDLNAMGSCEESMAYLRERLRWDESNPVVAEFIGYIEKRFR
ncbi:MAG: hypothetical protein LBD28_04880 [Tannerellaceae bacterium]|jgi:hypothetical protein|nr:hypothetical protein [Tannerellaceae bacterium]